MPPPAACLPPARRALPLFQISATAIHEAVFVIVAIIGEVVVVISSVTDADQVLQPGTPAPTGKRRRLCYAGDLPSRATVWAPLAHVYFEAQFDHIVGHGSPRRGRGQLL